MSKKEKLLLKASIAFAVMFAVTPAINAMHIMEGYLPTKYCIAWGVICVPFLAAGFISLKKRLRQTAKVSH
ncbi:cobalt transport protein CbiM [Clostridium sp. C105KSO13]|nr:cobalt transport protein CbiM [Clostridium sp. C105KSO13]